MHANTEVVLKHKVFWAFASKNEEANLAEIIDFQEFPGGPVVRTPHSHHQGPKFNP